MARLVEKVTLGIRFPSNTYFFAIKWARLRKTSKLLEKDQTMYSFRHSGSLEVFEQTGSLVKLQQVMGQGYLQVYLSLDQMKLTTYTN